MTRPALTVTSPCLRSPVASAAGRAATSTRRASRPGSTSSTTSRCSRPARRLAPPLDEWSFTIDGAVDERASWTWEELLALPPETFTVDIHCVTKWSKLGTTWTGVSVDTLLEGVETEAEYLTAWCDGGYTTNLRARGRHRRPRLDRARRSRASRWSPSTAVRRGCSCRTCTSGRARSGCGG